MPQMINDCDGLVPKKINTIIMYLLIAHPFKTLQPHMATSYISQHYTVVESYKFG